MPIAQNHTRKDAEKIKQNPKDRTKIHCTNNKNLLQNKTKQKKYSLERKGKIKLQNKFRRVTAAADRATKDPQLQLRRRFAELVNKDCCKPYLHTKTLSGMSISGEKLAIRV
jgi:hypothetical protein